MALYAGFGLFAAAVLMTVLHLIFGWGGHTLTVGIKGVVPAVMMPTMGLLAVLRAVSQRPARLARWLTAAGLSSYGIAFLIWGAWLQHTIDPPFPSPADFFWVSFYVITGASVIVAQREAKMIVGNLATVRIWLDCTIAATAMAAIATAFVLPAIVHASQARHSAVITDLIYPILDLGLGVTLVGVAGTRNWQVDRQTLMILLAWTLLFGSDCVWATEIARGAVTGGDYTILCYLLAAALAAGASWQRSTPPEPNQTAHWPTLVVPAVFGFVAPAIMVVDHFSRIPLSALILTFLSLLVTTARTALGLRDILSMNDMRRAALTDELTNLPNRRSFYAHLREHIARHLRDGSSMTVFILDFDNFKQLNDTLGHDAGDLLLQMVGPRLQEVLSPEDIFARLGGDEFAVLVDHRPRSTPRGPLGKASLTELDKPVRTDAGVAQEISSSLSKPFNFRDISLRLTASIGSATYPQDARTQEALLKCADIAMYQAKVSRRGWAHYAPERDENTRERLLLATDLAIAIDTDPLAVEAPTGRIEAHFQPIADTATRRLIAAEALARWRRADGTLVPPDGFLDAAEISGLSRQLTRRMLTLALTQARIWREQVEGFCISVNTTVADLLDESFPSDVAAILAEHQYPPEALKLEITEGSIMADPERVGAVLKELQALGIMLALDDFGTGYSSLTHLRDFPVDLVKIDRSFVSAMTEHETDAAIVYATIELAHRLKLRVVAEGVEDERTWAELHELKADHVQGYAYGRPMEASAFTQFVARQLCDHLAASQSGPVPASTASGGSIV